MRRDCRAIRRIGALAAAIVLVVSARTAVAAPAVKIENIRFGFKGRAKPGSWTPVWVDLQAGKAPFRGILEVEVPDDDGTNTVFRREVLLDAGAFDTFSTYARFSSFNDKIRVRIVQDRTVLAEKESNLLGGSMQANQVLVVMLGSPRGVGDLASQIDPRLPAGSAREVAVVVSSPERLPEGVPGRWYGYDGANVVVLDTADQATLDALNTRGEALRRWVANGGHLVVAVGRKWQAVQDGFLSEMLPARPTGRMRLNDLSSLETFAGANVKPIVPAGGGALEVTKLEPIAARGAKPLDATAATPLIVRGYHGFGRVTVVGLDVDEKPFADWAGKKQFWSKILDIRIRANDDETSSTAGSSRYYSDAVSDLATTLHASLQQFPGVRLVPFGWVAFFVFLYILLIGPGDYFFLKKVVKRMEWTWATFPLIVVTVSLLAYAAAYRIKGTDLRVNKADVVDLDQISGLARGTSWITVFSPENRDYDVAVGLPETFSKTGPNAIGETIVTWFGAPENQFGGMGGSNRMALSSLAYSYEPIGEPSRLSGVRMLIWSTKGLYGRWTGRAKKAIDAQIVADGPDRLRGSIANATGRKLLNAQLIWKTHVFNLGSIEPGATASINADRPLTLSSEVERLKRLAQSQMRPNATSDSSSANQAAVLRAMMFNNAASVNNETVPSGIFHDLDLTGLAELERPMLVAEVDDPGAKLDLGRTSSEPKIRQTTLLRVILASP